MSDRGWLAEAYSAREDARQAQTEVAELRRLLAEAEARVQEPTTLASAAALARLRRAAQDLLDIAAELGRGKKG